MKQNRTRTALADAYMHLLNDYTIDRITVKMITDAVGCSRKTFYYYFTDVYVLTQYVFELRVQQFLDTNGNFETMREGFLTLAANLSNDRQAILNIYHGYGKEELERFTWETSDYYARQAITRYMKREGQLWIRIFPDKPITKKPAEVRMGKGKGNPEGFVAPVTPGRILFEAEGVPLAVAQEALRLGAQKLPITTKFIVRRDYVETTI